uniref:Uncharacterized protein n=1 Tax=Arundo donax TaxID=35708 RepID=A0A0A9HEV8_ARUDO
MQVFFYYLLKYIKNPTMRSLGSLMH